VPNVHRAGSGRGAGIPKEVDVTREAKIEPHPVNVHWTIGNNPRLCDAFSMPAANGIIWPSACHFAFM